MFFPVKDNKDYSQLTGRGVSSLTLKKEPVEATQDHLNHFNDHGNFTIHRSQPAQQVGGASIDERGTATTEHGIPNKYKQQDRYNRAVGLDVPPGRPEKHIVDKDPKSIYDQHPYENVQHDLELNRQSEEIYEQVVPSVPQHRDFDEVDNWNDLPTYTTNGELIRQPAFKSSIDIRPQPPEMCVRQGRFTMGSANGLDIQTHSSLGDGQAKRTDASRNFDVCRAASRRANYQHSNTDPTDQLLQECYPGSPESIRSSTGKHLDGVQTEPRPHNFKSIYGLTYCNLSNTKSSRTRSVDNIVKGIERDPCPRITGKSIFYDTLLANGELL